MFFLIPKNVTCERPIALMPTLNCSLVGSFESTRSGKVAAEIPRGWGRHGWSKRGSSTNGVGKIDGNGKFYGIDKEEDQGAVALVPDLSKAFERVSLLVVWAWATHFTFTRKVFIEGAMRVLRAPEACTGLRMCGGAAPDQFGHLARVQVEFFALADCTAGCIE